MAMKLELEKQSYDLYEEIQWILLGFSFKKDNCVNLLETQLSQWD